MKSGNRWKEKWQNCGKKEDISDFSPLSVGREKRERGEKKKL
jgi:hypothetical protein